MKKYFIVAALTIFVFAIFMSETMTIESATKPETRCGWFENPTPSNAWLLDRTGEWIIGLQMGYQARGEWPQNFGFDEWIETNGHYGYGCACMKVISDRKEMKIIQIISATAKPLTTCRRDKTINRKEPGH